MHADMIEAGLNDWRMRWSKVLEAEAHAKRQAQSVYHSFSEHRTDLATLHQALADVGAVLQRADKLRADLAEMIMGAVRARDMALAKELSKIAGVGPARAALDQVALDAINGGAVALAAEVAAIIEASG